MRVWITGVQGFIGRHVAEHLAAGTAEVFGLGYGAWPEPERRALGCRTVLDGEVSRANLEALADRVGLPDSVFHLAGGSSVGLSLETPEEDFRRSVDSVAQLLEWGRKSAPLAHFIFASSAAVYGEGHRTPICETAPLAPVSPYGYHKQMGELLFQSYTTNFHLTTSTVRLFSVYGPGLRKQLLWDLCSRLELGCSSLALAGTGYEVRDWLHVHDAVRILVRASELASPDGFTVNGATGVGVCVRDIAERVCAAWGRSASIEFTGQRRRGDPGYLVADTTRLGESGSCAEVPWDVGVDEYVKWYKGQIVQTGH